MTANRIISHRFDYIYTVGSCCFDDWSSRTIDASESWMDQSFSHSLAAEGLGPGAGPKMSSMDYSAEDIKVITATNAR